MNKYLAYLQNMILELEKQEEMLRKSDRKDEANFVKIKINICDICKTIYHVSAKKKQGTELSMEYAKQLTKLPENWKIVLEKARKHNDIQKMIIEETKIEMLELIRSKFEEIGAEEQDDRNRCN